MTDEMVYIILQFCASHLQFLDLLVGGEIDFLFDAIDGVIEPVVFVVNVTEVVVASLKTLDGIAVLRELSEDRMM